MPNIGFEIKRKCKVCGAVFVAKTLDSQYCSPKCSKGGLETQEGRKGKERTALPHGTAHPRHQGVCVGEGGCGDVRC